jgi:antitoxin component of MazEF toxin-antitoxin module
MEELINKLRANPNYDMEWIEQAAWFILNGAASEKFLAAFTAAQLVRIKTIIATPYAQLLFNPKFNSTQLTILATCIQKNFKPEIINELANPDIPYQAMDYIAQGFEEGLDWRKIEDYIEFNPEQCFEILNGFRIGVNYTAYAAIIVPAPIMHMISTGLKAGLDVKYSIDTQELLVRPKNVLQKPSLATNQKEDRPEEK